ncbi:MAG: hypothetical protein WD801_12800 [Gemmatimonadaceae bacterium]
MTTSGDPPNEVVEADDRHLPTDGLMVSFVIPAHNEERFDYWYTTRR